MITTNFSMGDEFAERWPEIGEAVPRRHNVKAMQYRVSH
jgi:hypothetical protein